MASETLSSIRTQALATAGVSSDDPKFPTETTTAFVNKALRKVSTTFDPWWLQTSSTLSVVAGTTSYATSLLTRFYKMQRIENSLGWALTGVGKRELNRYQRQTMAPSVYVVEENLIKIGPVPNAADTLTAHYYQYESPLVGDDDQPSIPEQYTGWLVDATAYLIAAKAKDWPTVSHLRDEIAGWEKRMRDDIRQMTANPRIVLRDEADWTV